MLFFVDIQGNIVVMFVAGELLQWCLNNIAYPFWNENRHNKKYIFSSNKDLINGLHTVLFRYNLLLNIVYSRNPLKPNSLFAIPYSALIE